MALIAHYRLDGNANDSIGDKHGVPTSGVTWEDGKIGSSASVPSSSHVKTPLVINEAWAFSVSFWMFNSTYSNWHIAIGTSNWTENGGWHFGNGSRDFGRFGFHTASFSDRSTLYYDDFPYDEWVHVVGTYDYDGTKRLYKNGELVSETFSHPYAPNSHPLNIGNNSINSNGDANRSWSGLLDDVRIYNHALSLREVRDLSLGAMTLFPLRVDSIDDVYATEADVINADLTDDGYVFTGEDSYLDLGEDIRFSSLSDNDPITVAAWIYPTEFTSRDMILSKNPGRSTNNYTFMFGLISGNMNAYTGSSWRSFSTSSLIPLNDWSHICWTFDGSTLTGFVNGVQIGSRSDFSYTNKEPNTTKIGGYHSPSDFNGIIRDHRVYSQSLTADQVKEIYQQRASLDSSGSLFSSISTATPLGIFTEPSGSSHNGSYGLRFTVNKPLIINSCIVRPYFTGSAKIQLYDFDDQSEPVNEKDIDVVSGENNFIELDFLCVPGVNYWMTPEGGNFMRTDSGVSFPIEQGPFVLTRGTNSGGSTADRYYYFFDLHYSETFELSRQWKLGDFSEAAITKDISHWYPLVTDGLDYAGNNHTENNGATIGNGATFSDGSFIASSEQITVNPSEGYTVALWVKLDSLTNDWTYAIHLNEGSDNVGVSAIWGGVTSSNELSLTLDSDTTSHNNGSTGVIPELGRWYHLCAIWDGSTVRVYLDGVERTSYSLSSFKAQTSTLRMGSHISSYRRMNGTVRDVRIYNNSLTVEELGILYNITNSTGSQMSATQNCLYIKGQIKEVIA